MPQTASNRLIQPAGEGRGKAAAMLNINWQLIDDSLDGAVTVAVAAPQVALAAQNYTTDQARCRILVLTGAVPSPCRVVIPNAVKWYGVVNNCTGPGQVSVGTSLGNAVAVATGSKSAILCDGTDTVLLTYNGAAASAMRVVSAPATLAPQDQGMVLVTRPVAVTLPPAASVPSGWTVDFVNAGPGVATILTNGTDAAIGWRQKDALLADDGVSILTDDLDNPVWSGDWLVLSVPFRLAPSSGVRMTASPSGWLALYSGGADPWA